MQLVEMEQVPPGDALFVRRDELDLLRRLAAAARDGNPKTVLITGPAGSGKSALVSALLRDLGDDAFVLVGACPPVAGVDLPLSALVQVLRSLTRHLTPEELSRVLGPARDVLGRLSPALAGDSRPSTDALSLGLVFEHVLGVFDRLAEGRKLVAIVFDGLQWGGPTTWDLVAHLATNIVTTPILVVATVRGDELPSGGAEEHLLVELRRREAVTVVDLRPLDEARSEELLSAWMPTLPASSASGSPRSQVVVLMLSELAKAAARGEQEIPSSVREIVLDRLATLSEPSVGLVRLASVAGRSATADLLLRASGVEEQAAIAGLREAVHAELLRAPRDDRDAFVFGQEVGRQVVYDDLVPGERARLHGAVARVLSSTGSSGASDVDRSVELAAHWRASGDAARALPALIRAAEAAERGYAFPEAHRLYEEALTIVEAAQPTRSRRPIGFQMTATTSRSEWADVRSKAAEAASLAGQPGRAVALIDAALEGGLEPRWQERRARYLLDDGKTEESLLAYYRLVEALPDDGSSDDAMPRTLVAYARALTTAGRNREAEQVAERALAAARSRGARTEEWLALVVAGTARAQRGDLESSLAYLADARRIAAERPSATMMRPRPTRIGEILGGQLAASRALDWVGRPEDAASWSADVGREADRLGAAGGRSSWTWWLPVRRIAGAPGTKASSAQPGSSRPAGRLRPKPAWFELGSQPVEASGKRPSPISWRSPHVSRPSAG